MRAEISKLTGIKTMTGSEIISSFYTNTDDQTELSEQEMLDLMNNVYQNIYRNRHWEWLKTQATGVLSTTVPYISLPADFIALTENAQTTDNTVEIQNNAGPKVVYVGSNYDPYQIVNWSDRRKYINKKGYAYLDMKNKRLVFTMQPTVADSYEFDYIAKPEAIELDTEPVFSSDFHIILVYGMKILNYGIQLFDRTASYQNEDVANFNKTFADMCYENAQFQNN